jgi:hypothetical protein
MKSKYMRVVIHFIPCLLLTFIVWLFNDMSFYETFVDITAHLWSD